MWELIAEILKFTIPALIVFLTSYFILKKYLDAQYRYKSLEIRGKYSRDAIPIKLQAYERLLLFCERISIPNLILRLRTSNMSVETLRNSMFISVQKEYEHNIAQQLYTSSQLWEIIKLTKNDVLSMISQQGNDIPPNENALLLTDVLYDYLKKSKSNPIDIAIKAIKEEAKIILDV